jgi:ribosome-associated protein
VEAILDVAESSLSPEHQRRVIARYGPRVTATAQDARSQARNRELALERLQRRLSSALQPRRQRVETRPTQASVRRRLQDKRRRSERKRDRRAPPGDEG